MPLLHITQKGISVAHETDEFVWVRASAGELWSDFVDYCVAQDYGGVENLALIYGTVGAAPVQNIGAYGVELKDVFDCCDAICIKETLSIWEISVTRSLSSRKAVHLVTEILSLSSIKMVISSPLLLSVLLSKITSSRPITGIFVLTWLPMAGRKVPNI